MSNSNLAIAEAYFAAMSAKNIASLEVYLHPDIELIAPLAKVTEKAAVLEQIIKAMSLFNTLIVRTKFSSDDHAIVIYDVEFPAPVGKMSTAALLTFQDSLIIKIELFYDARAIEKTWGSQN